MADNQSLVPAERIERSILLIRGHKVILDVDLAAIYGVMTGRLNQQVRRNIDRFPADFAFALTQEEFANLKLQLATSSSGWGGRRKPPLAFTEHGAVMAASVLNSPVAVAASIQVVRAFVRLRQILASNAEFAQRLKDLEAKYVEHDKQLVVVFEAIRQLMEPPPEEPEPERGHFGFRPTQKQATDKRTLDDD